VSIPADVQVPLAERSAVISAEPGNDLLGTITKVHVGKLAVSYSVRWSDGREVFLGHEQVLPVAEADVPLFEQARQWRNDRRGKLDHHLAVLCQPRPHPDFPGDEWTPADVLALGRMLDRLHRDELRESFLLGREGNEPGDDQAENADMLEQLYLFGKPYSSGYWGTQLETAEGGTISFRLDGPILKQKPWRGLDYGAEINTGDVARTIGRIPLFVGYATATDIAAALDEHGAVARWPRWENNLTLILPHTRNPSPAHVFER